jgi:hypothetical protein
MPLRRYRSNGIYGGRVREHSGRKIDRETRNRSGIAAQVAEDDRLYRESMANAAPNPHTCDTHGCCCHHAGACCNECTPF